MSEIVITLATVVTAVATGVLAYLTWMLAKENEKLRKAGSEPNVVAYLSPHPDANGGVNFILSNVGQGPAFDIRFSLLCDEEDFSSHRVHLRNSPDRAALNVLPQGERISALFGIGYVLFGNSDGVPDSILKPFDVTISYKDISGAQTQKQHTIDIQQFVGMGGLVNKPPLLHISQNMENIANHLAEIARRSNSSAQFIDRTELSDSYVQKEKPAPEMED